MVEQQELNLQLTEVSFGLTREELAWMAGFFDGEGSICIAHTRWKGRYEIWTLQIAISQTLERILRQLQASFGGSLFCKHAKFIKAERASSIWIWTLTGKRGQMFLKTLLPFLRVKFEQAQIGIAFQDFYAVAQGSVLCSEKARDFQRQLRQFGGHYKREGDLGSN